MGVTPIFTLSTEAIHRIIWYLPDEDQASVVRTCKRLHAIGTPVLYTLPIETILYILEWGSFGGHPQVEAMKKCIPAIEAHDEIEPDFGTHAMTIAARGGASDMVHTMRCHGISANPLSFEQTEENSPLMQAISWNHANIVKCLYDSGASIHNIVLPKVPLANIAPDAGPENVLMYAAMKGAYRALDFFLSIGMKPDTQDQFGRTALSRAAAGHSMGHQKCVVAFLNRHAPLNTVDNNGWSPLMHAVANGRANNVENLLVAGARMDLKDGLNRGALSHAAARGYAKIVDLLLYYGADLEEVDDRGRTPLSWAARNGHSHSLRLLIACGASPDHTDFYMDTPLHLATLKNRFSAVRALVEAGAGLNGLNRVGKTPLTVARERQFREIAALLHRAWADPMFEERMHRPLIAPDFGMPVLRDGRFAWV